MVLTGGLTITTNMGMSCCSRLVLVSPPWCPVSKIYYTNVNFAKHVLERSMWFGSWTRRVSHYSSPFVEMLRNLGDQDWVRDWMDILLNEDEGLYVSVLSTFKSGTL